MADKVDFKFDDNEREVVEDILNDFKAEHDTVEETVNRLETYLGTLLDQDAPEAQS